LNHARIPADRRRSFEHVDAIEEEVVVPGKGEPIPVFVELAIEAGTNAAQERLVSGASPHNHVKTNQKLAPYGGNPVLRAMRAALELFARVPDGIDVELLV
jgi:hypothetical protein